MNKELKRPDTNNCTEKEWHRWYWGDFNDLCKQCTKKCKQSHVVDLTCSQFEKLNNGENIEDKN